MFLKSDWAEKINLYSENGIEFLFMISYEMEPPPMVLKLSELNKSNGFCIKYFIDGVKNYNEYSNGKLTKCR